MLVEYTAVRSRSPIRRLTSNSTGGDGGGILCVSGTVITANSTIAFNTAGDQGGGLWVSGDATFTNCTLAYNQVLNASGNGGGLYVSSSSTVRLDNTIVALNTSETGGSTSADDIALDPDGAFVSANSGYNLIGNGRLRWTQRRRQWKPCRGRRSWSRIGSGRQRRVDAHDRTAVNESSH